MNSSPPRGSLLLYFTFSSPNPSFIEIDLTYNLYPSFDYHQPFILFTLLSTTLRKPSLHIWVLIPLYYKPEQCLFHFTCLHKEAATSGDLQPFLTLTCCCSSASLFDALSPLAPELEALDPLVLCSSMYPLEVLYSHRFRTSTSKTLTLPRFIFSLDFSSKHQLYIFFCPLHVST